MVPAFAFPLVAAIWASAECCAFFPNPCILKRICVSASLRMAVPLLASAIALSVNARRPAVVPAFAFPLVAAAIATIARKAGSGSPVSRICCPAFTVSPATAV